MVAKPAKLFKERLVMIAIYIDDRDFNSIFALNLKLWKNASINKVLCLVVDLLIC